MIVKKIKKTEPQNKWKNRGIRAGIILLSLLAFLLLMDKIIMPWFTHHGDVSILPKVVGMPEATAMQVLKDAGYEPIKYEVQYDNKAKEGTIIRQTPEGGDETKPGRKVYLIISSGKEMVMIPNLIGVPLKDARMILVRANLDVGKQSTAFSDSVQSGSVISQSPPAGSKISTAQKIDIVVSNGTQAGRILVPDLIGLSESQAYVQLGNAKLGVGKRTFVTPTNDQKSGTIVDQAPKAGELVLIGSAIDLFIAKDNESNPENEY
jgi:beta-lactam-binding protein with PASTA domain